MANGVNLAWSQVDLARGIAWIHHDQAKAERAIHVPLNTAALEVLRRRQGEHAERVFTFKDRPIGQANTRAWRQALARAGITDFRWHDLRHTWASWHAQSGTPLSVLQDLGAWRSEAMVRHNAHLSPGDYATYAESVAAPLGAAPARVASRDDPGGGTNPSQGTLPARGDSSQVPD